MKLFFISISFLYLTSSFTNFSKETSNSINSILKKQEYFKVDGLVVIQGQYKSINLTFISINGYIGLSSWRLNEGFSEGTPQQLRNLPIYGDGGQKKATPLNPNNQMAIKYNYTHLVETFYGPAYFIMSN